MAKIKNQNLENRISHIEPDENWRSSKSKSLIADSNLSSSNLTNDIDIAELSTQFIISSTHSGQVNS